MKSATQLPTSTKNQKKKKAWNMDRSPYFDWEDKAPPTGLGNCIATLLALIRPLVASTPSPSSSLPWPSNFHWAQQYHNELNYPPMAPSLLLPSPLALFISFLLPPSLFLPFFSFRMLELFWSTPVRFGKPWT